MGYEKPCATSYRRHIWTSLAIQLAHWADYVTARDSLITGQGKSILCNEKIHFSDVQGSIIILSVKTRGRHIVHVHIYL